MYIIICIILYVQYICNILIYFIYLYMYVSICTSRTRALLQFLCEQSLQGKLLRMVMPYTLCCVVFLQLSSSTPILILDPSEVAAAHWAPLSRCARGSTVLYSRYDTLFYLLTAFHMKYMQPLTQGNSQHRGRLFFFIRSPFLLHCDPCVS